MSNKIVKQARQEIKEEEEKRKIVLVKELLVRESNLETLIQDCEAKIEDYCLQIDKIRERIGSIKGGNYSVLGAFPFNSLGSMTVGYRATDSTY